MSEKLTDKKRRFVDEYLIDLNATQAAIRAGYSEKTARSQGQRLLTYVDIQEAISQRFHELSASAELAADKVISEIVKLAFADMKTYARWGPDGVELVASEELPEGASAAVAEVSESINKYGKNVRFKLHGKGDSLGQLLKYLQWLRETESLEARVAALEDALKGGNNAKS